MKNNERKAKNSEARIRANNKYTRANYKNVSIKIRPEQAEAIRETAKQFDISIAQLIINSVNEYRTNHGADTAQPEENPTKSPIESGETTGTQPEEETEEEPQEDEDEDEKPEEIPAFVWEQIQRLKKADQRQTAERKAREAAERKRRRLGEIED